MNRLNFFMAMAFASSVLLACNQNPDSTSNTVDKDSANLKTSTTEAQVIFQDAMINDAYTHYSSLKNALVASNVENASKSAASLSEALKKIKGCQNTADIATNIAGYSDLTAQRKDFTILNADFIALLKHADLEEGTVFVQYCPMANAGKGGYWMASNDEIRNPYYGDEMLNCGEVKETFSKK